MMLARVPSGGQVAVACAGGAAARARRRDAAALDAATAALARSRHRRRRRRGGGRAALLRWLGRRRDCGQHPAARRRHLDPVAATPAGSQYTSAGPDIIGLFPEPGGEAVTVAIVDYGSGNLHSAAKAFERAARESGHDQPIVVTSDPDTVRRADRVVLAGRRRLRRLPPRPRRRRRHGRCARRNRAQERPAVPRHLRRHAADGRARARICSDAGPWLDSPAKSIASRRRDPSLKIPHMGWNTLNAAGRPSAARRHPDRARRAARLFRAQLSPQRCRSRRPRRRGRLWRRGHGDRCARHCCRHAIPSRRKASGSASR